MATKKNAPCVPIFENNDISYSVKGVPNSIAQDPARGTKDLSEVAVEAVSESQLSAKFANIEDWKVFYNHFHSIVPRVPLYRTKTIHHLIAFRFIRFAKDVDDHNRPWLNGQEMMEAIWELTLKKRIEEYIKRGGEKEFSNIHEWFDLLKQSVSLTYLTQRVPPWLMLTTTGMGHDVRWWQENHEILVQAQRASSRVWHHRLLTNCKYKMSHQLFHDTSRTPLTHLGSP